MNAGEYELEPPPRVHRGDPQRSRSGFWVALLLLLPALYVLSIGPVAWIDTKFPFDDGTQSALEKFYLPLSLLFESEVPGVAPALEWYVELFID